MYIRVSDPFSKHTYLIKPYNCLEQTIYQLITIHSICLRLFYTTNVNAVLLPEDSSLRDFFTGHMTSPHISPSAVLNPSQLHDFRQREKEPLSIDLLPLMGSRLASVFEELCFWSRLWITDYSHAYREFDHVLLLRFRCNFFLFQRCPSRLGSKSILFPEELVWICRIQCIFFFFCEQCSLSNGCASACINLPCPGSFPSIQSHSVLSYLWP